MYGKDIILGMPKNHNFYKQIKKNLEFYGFNVIYIDNFPKYIKNFKYKNLRERLYSAFRKIILRDYLYKKRLKEKLLFQSYESLLAGKSFDYALLIRPDLYPLTLLNLIKDHTKGNMIAYQWDGLCRTPDVRPCITLFDKFFIFDAYDLQDENYQDLRLIGITNFYFDIYQPKTVKHNGTVAYFVGAHIPERVADIDNCVTELIKNNIILKFIIPTSNLDEIGQYQNTELLIFGSENEVDFAENIKNINLIDIIVDFINPIHHGLSFRIFEALYYHKKLITNNLEICKYDFYNPSNILIWSQDTHSNILAEFLSKPLVDINPDIVKKYSFYNWIKNILNLPPFITINLPEV